jgi:hypothetical protein
MQEGLQGASGFAWKLRIPAEELPGGHQPLQESDRRLLVTCRPEPA